MAPIGIIFTGGPNSVYLDTAPHVDHEILPGAFHLGYLLWMSADGPQLGR